MRGLIWLDALTPKQARLFSSIYRELGKIEGLELILTARDYAETLQILELNKIPHTSVGRYGGVARVEKLVAYAVRAQKLVYELHDKKICALISLSSPSAVRVAFGLGVPSITLNDTPHAFHVGRITLPLSTKVIAPVAIPKRELVKLGAEENNILQYDGVDEVAWIKSNKPDPHVLEEIGLEEEPFVVFRPPEEKAAYLSGLVGTNFIDLIRFVARKGIKAVFFPRYPEQRKSVEKISGIIVPKRAVDTPSLYFYSSLVITGGGTMAREGALLGVPSISLFPLDYPLYVNEYLKDRGFPIYRFRNCEEAFPLISKILENPEDYRINTESLLEELESPMTPIKRSLEEIRCIG